MSEEAKQEVAEESVEDLFNAALDKNKSERKEKEERRKGSGSGGSYEKIEWFGTEHAVERVFRIVGLPVETRKKGSDAKIVYHSKMLNDKKDGYMNIIWDKNKDDTINEDWILHRLYSLVMKKNWSPYEDGVKDKDGRTGKSIPVNPEAESFKRLDTNLKKDASPKFWPPSSRFKTRVLMNVIDRHDTWCADNKHTKVLTSKNQYWKDDDKGNPITFADMGVPEMVYNRIMDDVVQFRHHWNLDIIIKKNKDDLQNAYGVKDAMEDKLEEATKEIANIDPMTKEEQEYEMYNFDEMNTFKVTKYYTMYKRLIGLFKMVDAEFGQNFTTELEALVEKEQAEISKEETEKISEDFEKDIKKEKSETPVENKAEEVKEESKQEEVKEEAPVQRRGQAEDSLDQYTKSFPGWMNISEKEQAEMKKCISSFEDNIPIYANPSDALPCMDKDCKFPNSEIFTKFPSRVITCPVCSKKDATAK